MYLEDAGPMALGSRLRMLSERITEDAGKLYERYGIGLKPKWFPVFFVLSRTAHLSITEIAGEIGHSHPSVCKIVREMSVAGLVIENADLEDGRKNLVALSGYGKKVAVKIRDQYTDVETAIKAILGQTQHDLWNAMIEFEYLLDQKSLVSRVLEQRKDRESGKVAIVPYRSEYKEAFKKLNEEWIRKYFKMEAPDHKTLDHPEASVIDPGGHILVALFDQRVVGVCALIRSSRPGYDFELAKMGVAPDVRGLGIGWVLGKAVVEKAHSLGAKKLFLESNTVLEPAIALYRKLGFKKVPGRPSPYQRSNIQMELTLE